MKRTWLLAICYASAGLIGAPLIEGTSFNTDYPLIAGFIKIFALFMSYGAFVGAIRAGDIQATKQKWHAWPFLLPVAVVLGLVAGCGYLLSVSMAQTLNRTMGSLAAVACLLLCFAAGFLGTSARHGHKSPIDAQ